MKKPAHFSIEGLFGVKTVDLPIEKNALILVGPNGAGKSTVTNIFYFFISRQWSRLLEYSFASLTISFDDGSFIKARREEIGGLIHLDRLLSTISPGSRFRMHVEMLRNTGLLESMLSDKLSSKLRQDIANILEIPTREVNMLRASLRRRLINDHDTDLFETPRENIEKHLTEAFPGRTLYLPTYRRIERDIDDIFPEFEERVRQSGYGPSALSHRSGKHYVDLVSFGMEDVRKTIRGKLNSLRDYSLAQFNALSGLYLRDVIRGKAQEFSQSQISSLSEGALSLILSRVSEEVLSVEDKALLREKILKVSTMPAGPAEPSDSYLAHYFTLLMNVSDDISEQEEDVSNFINVCNAYLEPSKEIIYDDTKFEFEIVDDGGHVIDLSELSSGEKQVVSLFSHLYLDTSESQIVIIDEPELSLSVPWQKRLLPDITRSRHCQFVMAVTHSPFIYENELSQTAVDLRRYTTGF